MPVNIGPMIRSPTNSWLPTAVASPLRSSPTFHPPGQANGTRVKSPSSERPARQDKKRLSLAFFKGGSINETSDQKSTKAELKAEKQATAEELLDAVSSTASSRSRSKDRSRNRLSLSFLAPTSPPVEALPAFPGQQSNQHGGSGSYAQSRSQSIDSRPETSTSKSVKSGKSDHQKKGSSVRKRLSILHIGKKSSKNSVKGRGVNDTLMEE